MNVIQPDAPPPDRDAIEKHLAVLFDGLDGYAAVRIFPEKGGAPGPRETPFERVGRGLASAVYAHACRAVRSGRGIYLVPGSIVAPGSARSRDVRATQTILVDLDIGDVSAKREYLVGHLGQPTLEVASGGSTPDGQAKLHLYWQLMEPAIAVDVAEVCRIRRLIALKSGADRAFGSAHQPIRLAGSVHLKDAVATPVRVISHCSVRYDLRDVASAADAMQILAGVGGPIPPDFRKITIPKLVATPVHEGGIDGTTRFEALSRVTGYWIRLVRLGALSRAEALVAVLEYNAACIRPPWPEQQLTHEFEALYRLDQANEATTPIAAQKDASASEANLADLSEDSLAEVFRRRHGEDWRFVPSWGLWLKWDGTRWIEDDVGGVFEHIRRVCRESLRHDATAGERRRIKSDRTIRAVERIARTDPAHSASADIWDQDLELLNTPAGVVDLRTGELRRNARETMITRIARASPKGDSPRWRQFVDEISGGVAEMRRYLARVAGYCLSGNTQEQVFFFLQGSGANGKSLFLSVLADVLGSYAATAPLDTFMVSRGERHPTDLAGLRGTRLVAVNETETGRAWSEARIKAISGGDMVRVRFMHHDFFEFRPTFKLLVAGNHRPRLEGVGEAMRRRLHLIPFDITIPADQRDTRLFEKLIAERDGILAWMIDGHAEWRRTGLLPPAAVTNAARDYFVDEDVIGQWIADTCRTHPSATAASATLFASWSDWAQSNGIVRGSMREFAEALKVRGFGQRRSSNHRGWSGIMLRSTLAVEGEQP